MTRMWSAASTTQALAHSFASIGAVLGVATSAVLGAWAGLAGLAWAMRKTLLWVYNGGFGERMRGFGKPRWKGYKWYHSEEWNMNNTL